MTNYEISGDSIRVPQRETARYLGYRGIVPDERIADRIEFCIRQLQAKCRPRAVWESYPLQMTPVPTRETKEPHDGSPAAVLFCIQNMSFVSRSLARNLRNCTQVALMAATIGTEADFLIRRAEAANMSDAAIYQAAGAAMAEAWCDEVNRRINRAMGEQGFFARPRFSPGYGDVPLSLQKDFSSLLRMPITCGISLTDTLLMIPSKSVTAFIGFAENEEPCVLEGCEVCKKQDSCLYKR